MNTNTGVACNCTGCSDPQWYDAGKCQGCNSDTNITFTWIATTEQGGIPSAAPGNLLQLEKGVGAQLVEVWTNLVLLRGLSPYLTPSGQSIVQYSSAPWYKARDVDATVHFTVSLNTAFSEKLNRASTWTNQSLLVRIQATFEAFAQGKLSSFKLPNNPGMREFHHARRLRNAIAHGDTLTATNLVNEAIHLFGPEAVDNGSCKLAIDKVLEPLWARLLLYATSVEDGSTLPPRPGVVVTTHDSFYDVQTFDGILRVPRSGSGLTIGEIVSL